MSCLVDIVPKISALVYLYSYICDSHVQSLARVFGIEYPRLLFACGRDIGSLYLHHVYWTLAAVFRECDSIFSPFARYRYMASSFNERPRVNNYD